MRLIIPVNDLNRILEKGLNLKNVSIDKIHFADASNQRYPSTARIGIGGILSLWIEFDRKIGRKK